MVFFRLSTTVDMILRFKETGKTTMDLNNLINI